MEGSTVPLVVKWDDTEKERKARRAQKAFSPAYNVANLDSRQHTSLFGALPMGYMPPYNGYNYQGEHAFHNYTVRAKYRKQKRDSSGSTPVSKKVIASRDVQSGSDLEGVNDEEDMYASNDFSSVSEKASAGV